MKRIAGLIRIMLLGMSVAGCLLPLPSVANDDYYYWYRYKGSVYGPDKNNSKGNAYDQAHAAREKDMVSYRSAYAAWQEKANAYSNRLAQIKDYDDRHAEYLKNVADWAKMTGTSGVGVTLDRNSYPANDPTKRMISQLTEAVEVPPFSDISTYRTYCQGYSLTNGVVGGTLTCLNKYDDGAGVKSITFTYSERSRRECWPSGEGPLLKRDARQLGDPVFLGDVNITRTVAEQHISGGYAGAVYPFVDKIADVSDVCEQNSVVLIGTLKYPIELNGPVYVDGDVVIRGFVKGQGSIYAGRNIHIIGDITYYDPPSWPHDTDDLKKAENTPEKVKERNKSKNLLLLAARGNIIVGDYTSLEWTNATQMAYLNLNGKTLKAHTTSEVDIGYSAGYPKNRNYTEKDGGKTIENFSLTIGPNTYGNVPGDPLPRYHYTRTYDFSLKVRDRKYYESSLGGLAIQNLKQTSATVGSRPTWRNSASLWKRILAVFGLYSETQTVTDNTDSGDVTEIDAILYANHGIFGVAGGSKLKKLHLNGAMICRDEGLLTSFAGRFRNDSSARAWINWDMRIKSDLDGSVHIGAPEKESSASRKIKVNSITWDYAR